MLVCISFSAGGDSPTIRNIVMQAIDGDDDDGDSENSEPGMKMNTIDCFFHYGALFLISFLKCHPAYTSVESFV